MDAYIKLGTETIPCVLASMTCGTCGTKVSYTVTVGASDYPLIGLITIKPCPRCLETERQEGREHGNGEGYAEGLESGYHRGYDDAIGDAADKSFKEGYEQARLDILGAEGSDG